LPNLGHRRSETPFRCTGQRQPADASVDLIRLASNQTECLGPADQLGHRALPQLETFGELGERRALAAVGGALDHQEQRVALGCQADVPGAKPEGSEAPADEPSPPSTRRSRSRKADEECAEL
jgi:hypothetical protein